MAVMKKPSRNIDIYVKVAKKLGFKTERMQATPTRKLLCISNGKKFFMINTGTPGFYPEVSRWSATLTGSKLLTQKMLKRYGYKIISSHAVRFGDFKSKKEMVASVTKKHKVFPVLIKPDRGHDGKNIVIIENATQLKKVAKKHFDKKDDFIIQPILDQCEYRILVVNNKVMLMHSKHNLKITGDGKSTIKELLGKIDNSKKDPAFIKLEHKKHNTKPTTILEKGTTFDYHLTKIPTDKFYATKDFPKAAKKWAVKLAKDMSTPILGIDVFIPKGFSDTSTYTVIELNSNPAVYYLPFRCNDEVTGEKIVEKVITDYFKK